MVLCFKCQIPFVHRWYESNSLLYINLLSCSLALLTFEAKQALSWGFPCGSASKESPCNVGDLGLIPRLGRSAGEGKGHPLQYSGLENSMDCVMGFPVGASSKELPANAGVVRDLGSIPASGRSRGEGNGNPLQSSCLENPMDRGAWQAIVHGVTESDMTE